jgi:hypothetical protein
MTTLEVLALAARPANRKRHASLLVAALVSTATRRACLVCIAHSQASFDSKKLPTARTTNAAETAK